MSTSPFLPADDPRAGRCAACGAPMAADQRYCLSCGARRDHARLPFQDALVPAPAAAVPPALWYPPQGAGTSTTTILAALACVLLAFGVGVLVGGDGDDRPVVVGATPGAVAPVAATPAATTTEEAAASEDDAADEEDDADTEDDAKADESTIPDTPLSAEDKKDAEEVSKIPAKVPAAKKVDDSLQKKLESKDPDEAREASQALPDAVSTGD
ncbi:hypothetical protein ACVU7I_12370 [Patulibacter sp. S7RM1-6]